MKRYSSSPDRISTLLPYVIVVINVVIFAAGIIGLNVAHIPVYVMLAITSGPLILLAVTVGTYYLRPLSVVIDDQSIIVERKYKPVIILFRDISSVRAVEKEEMKNATRLIGSSGMWGYFGTFFVKKLGSMTWYCTQRQSYVLIEKTKSKIVITPDYPDEFLKDLYQAVPSLKPAG